MPRPVCTLLEHLSWSGASVCELCTIFCHMGTGCHWDFWEPSCWPGHCTPPLPAPPQTLDTFCGSLLALLVCSIFFEEIFWIQPNPRLLPSSLLQCRHNYYVWGLGLWLRKGVTPTTEWDFSVHMVASELLSVPLCVSWSGKPHFLLRALDGSTVGKGQTQHSFGNPCVSSGHKRFPSFRWSMDSLGLHSC